jgi:hypothetical protein
MVMKKITFTADEYLLDRAERIAKEKGLLSNTATPASNVLGFY